MNTPLICAGFHRSGTSLAAQQLHRMGLSYALKPMNGNLSNPDGHFEDEEAMRLHDHILAGSHADWMYAGSDPFIIPPGSVDALKRYIAARNRVSGDAWLMKDPRATLMLEAWQEALGGSAHFVLIYRHWSYCVQSLLKRHAQDLVYCPPSDDMPESALAFWKDVTLAARMWLSYNHHLLAFAEAHPAACLVVSQHDLMQGVQLPSLLRDKFGWQVTDAEESCVNPDYVESSVDADVWDMLPDDLVQSLNAVFARLEALNHTGLKAPLPEAVTDRKSSDFPGYLATFISDRPLVQAAERDATTGIFSSSTEAMTLDDMVNTLNQHGDALSAENADQFIPVAAKLAKEYEFHFTGHEWLGRCALIKENYDEAEVHFLRAISINRSPPYLKMLLGDLYCAKFGYEQAAQYYRSAYELNPKNITFTMKVADMALLNGQPQKALNWYTRALETDHSEWVHLHYCCALSQLEGKEAALNYLKKLHLENRGERTLKALLTLQMELRKPGSVAAYYQYIRSHLSRDSVSALMTQISESGLSEKATRHLCHWITKAFLKVLTPSDFLALIVHVKGQSAEKPVVTAVVVSYNMTRELPRTLQTLQAPYQLGVNTGDIEIILVDNGSEKTPVPEDFPDIHNLRIVSFPFKTHSPVQALNLGLSLARSDLIGAFIDGARMASPGMMQNALRAARLSDNPVIATLGFHLGPEVQMQSVQKGYNQRVEDALLQEIKWQEDGYRLFSISALAGSSANGFFQPIAESNALFMPKKLWNTLGGLDENFVTPGGGLANLDLYRRACEYPGNELIILLGEGTFHQVHGGVATNLQREDATPDIFGREYYLLRGEAFSPPQTEPLYLGRYVPAAAPAMQFSLSKAVESKTDSQPDNATRLNLNRTLLNSTYCPLFTDAAPLASDMIDAPVIITGRGGSGTRLLSQLMQDMDIFLGNDINKTEDSVEWLGPVYDMVIHRIRIENDNFEQKHIDRLRRNAENILKKGGFESGLWGFKLPETILCLPELKKAFPKARFIHLTRHPVSVSLRRTHLTSRLDNSVGKAVLEDAYKFIGKDPASCQNEVDEVNNSVSWNYQLSKAMAFLSELEEGKDVIQVKYEDIRTCPDQVLSSLCQFLGLKGDFHHSLKIDDERANLVTEPGPMGDIAWSICQDVATRVGYQKLGS